MRRPKKLRYRLLTPLVYLAALILMLEEWLWDLGERVMSFMSSWPPLHALESRIRALSPYAALSVFVLPAVLLFPVKLLALFAITQGHAIWGVSVIVVAKVVGAGAVARLYALTRLRLMELAWFARWQHAFMRHKDRWIARLRATRAFRETRLTLGKLRAGARALWLTVRPKRAIGRRSTRPSRVLRRFVAFWRARRRALMHPKTSSAPPEDR